MRLLRRIVAIVVVAVKRILSQPGLALATTLGLVIAAALTMSIPTYADAVYYRTFLRNLTNPDGSAVARPPFALMFYYGGGINDALQWEAVQPADAYLSGPAGATLGLPQRGLVRHARTESYTFFPADETNFNDETNALAWVKLSFVSDLEAHITLLEGRFPAPAEPAADSTVEVLISEEFALETGIQAGEDYVVFVKDTTPDGIRVTQQIPVRIAGVWRATDPTEEFWFIQPNFLETHLVVPEATYMGRLSPYLPDEVHSAIWYLIMDGSDVDYGMAAQLVNRITMLEQQVVSLLPGTRLAISPRETLQDYQRAAEVLTLLLYAFSLPIIGLLLAFIGMTGNLATEGRRNEIAVLRSRGATAVQMVGVAALEGLLLGLIALALGSPASRMVADLMGQSRTFLDFSARSDLRTTLTTATFIFGVGVIALALAAQIFPTVGASRHTVVSYKQERARLLRRPWWQRAWLDALLLIPAVYGAYLLRRQGNIASVSLDPFQNPLLFLVPALGILALTLFFLRVMPALMAAAAWLAARTRSVSLLMAARHLSRTPGFYNTPLVLLVLTLSLSAFTASLAKTLDDHLSDQAYYRVGADVQFFDIGEEGPGMFTAAFGGGADPSAGAASSASEPEIVGPRWRFRPVSDYLQTPGVHAASRIGRFEASASLSGGTQNGRFLGVDRYDFARVAFWRKDFAPETLGALMNWLAYYPDGVLVPRAFMEAHALSINDTIRLVVRTYGERTDIDYRIVGTFDLFPTWYPEDGPLFVGNLDYLFEQIGGQVPYYVWLNIDPDVTPDQLDVPVVYWETPSTRIAGEQSRPERQGLFGLLSVGFAAAAVLTVLGFLLYALFSFRRRFIEMGVLRAIGLSGPQMVAFMAWELAFLVVLGGAVGTGLGALVSAFFIPYLQVGTGPSASTPPFVVEIAWPEIFRIYALFGLLFVVTLIVLAALLRRMKIFQAIKLGETV